MGSEVNLRIPCSENTRVSLPAELLLVSQKGHCLLGLIAQFL